MALYNTTRDLKLAVLQRAGEVTNGNSSYESRVVQYLNEAYLGVIAGGSAFGIDVDDPWVWAKARRPMTLVLEPAYETGTITFTNGSASATYSSDPGADHTGWYVKPENRDEYYKVIAHSGTSLTLDQNFIGTSGAQSFKTVKLDYELVSDSLVIDSENNKLDFNDGGSELTATLTSGVYTPSTLATELDTQLEAVGGADYTVTFDSVSRTFKISSSGAAFEILNGAGTNVRTSCSRLLGLSQEDLTGALTYESERSLNSIQRLVMPLKTHVANYSDTTAYYKYPTQTYWDERGKIYGISDKIMLEKFPFLSISQGNPDRFAVIENNEYGNMTVRFNKYPDSKIRVECEFIEQPLELKDNTASIPLVPKVFRSFLLHAATYYLMLDKSDNRASAEAELAAAKLRAMLNDNRKGQELTGKNYGRLVPRRDL